VRPSQAIDHRPAERAPRAVDGDLFSGAFPFVDVAGPHHALDPGLAEQQPDIRALRRQVDEARLRVQSERASLATARLQLAMAVNRRELVRLQRVVTSLG
jgi:hypothetical protein